MVSARSLGGLLRAGVLAVCACGPSAGDGDGDGDPVAPVADADGDSIEDDAEGRASGRDTDGDGAPDFEDADSDGDGIDDAREAGDDDPRTAPRDTDGDGAADFVDLDADDNQIADADESTDDALDGDGFGDWADLDDDGDGIGDAVELVDPADPRDTDGDQIPDYHDLDADGDSIADRDERSADRDGDGDGNYVDLDSDADCIADLDEAGDGLSDTPPIDSDADGSADFLDVDADADGLADAAEDRDCDGIADPGETSALAADSDSDGTTDLVESAAGTDPNDASDNPQANGDFVFLVPYEGPPDPVDDDLDFSTTLKQVDVYVLMDLSGSMADELGDVHANLAGVLDALTCPAGGGTAGECIPDLWSGLGTLTYAERAPYLSRIRMQPDNDAIGAATLAPDTGNCERCEEPHWLALWLAATGQGTAASTCTSTAADPLAVVPAAPSCAGSPAGAGGIGFPCFRPDALPVVLLATDEAPSASYTCPGEAGAIGALSAIGAKLIGIAGSGVTILSPTWKDLESLATGTAAVDAAGEPLVFAGAGSAAADAIEDAIRAVASNLPLDMAASAVDDPGDPVDAVASFVARLETLELGSAACADGLVTADGDGDGFADQFVDVLPGTPVCWSLVARPNTTVPPGDEPQLFRATVEVRGDGVTLLDTRDVYFLVPPALDDLGPE